ncbi:MAG: MFS transporter [Deltaproteobacteria bacterium]|nr:MFS transporter [Deltaproteobacteria bacterium]
MGEPSPSSSVKRSSPVLIVAVLTTMCLLNFIDRYAPSAVKDLFKAELGLSDEQTGLVFSAFIFVYTLACPVFGSLAERGNRPRLLAVGVALWSLATVAAAFADGFAMLVMTRALVGIGEAAFITISPAMIADLFPPARRNRALTVLNVAMPLGVAIGFTLAGAFGQWWGWRAAFVIVGAPGLLLALVALVLHDPPRGAFDEPGAARAAPPSWSGALRGFARNARWRYATGGYIAMTFALGGIGDWFPTFLSRERGFSLAEAGTVAGLSIVVGGLVGTVAGGVLGDALQTRVREAYFVVCGASCIPGLILAAWALFFAQGALAITVALTAAQVFLWMYNAPVNALLVNAVDVGVRARAFGVALMLTHLFGDVPSPPLIGAVSSATGSVAQGIGLALVAVGVAASVWLVGATRLGAPARE